MSQPPPSADARVRLREVALDLFGRQGVRDTSTREILKAAGMRNPSAITYHFGSKAELVEDLVRDVVQSETPVMQVQVELASRVPRSSIEEWVMVAVDSSARLISTERGCLLARLWWEYDGHLRPAVFEEFLGSDLPLATAWLGAVEIMFPDLPGYIGVARNVTMLRTLEWMIARRAGRILTGHPSPALRMDQPEAFHQLMAEVAISIVSAPTKLTESDITFED
jgi:AcrR family transcriptional regulator